MLKECLVSDKHHISVYSTVLSLSFYSIFLKSPGMYHYRTSVLTQIPGCTPPLLTRRPIPPFRENTDITVRLMFGFQLCYLLKCEYLKKVFNFSESHFV